MPLKYKTKDGVTLRKWLYNQKTSVNTDKEKIALLSRIGIKQENEDMLGVL